MELNGLIFPSPKASYSASSFKGELIWIPSDDMSIPCLFLQCQRGSSKVLLYFHANGEDLGLGYGLIDHMRCTLSVHVLAVEYPGYGIYKGKPSEEQINSDSLVIFDFLVNSIRMKPRDIIVFGRSIGSGPAIFVSAHRNPASLVLMSAFTSLRSAIKNIAGNLCMHLVKDRFQNKKFIEKVKCPCFLVHGQRDNIVPYFDSQILANACGGPCSVILPAEMDHNKFDYFEDLTVPLLEFLIQCGISVYPHSFQTAFVNIDKVYFESSTEQCNQNRGLINSFLKILM